MASSLSASLRLDVPINARSSVCVRQYQIIDSLGHYWAPNALDGWVNESELEPRLDPNGYFKILQRKPSRSASL
jgi:hypothetical protein